MSAPSAVGNERFADLADALINSAYSLPPGQAKDDLK